MKIRNILPVVEKHGDSSMIQHFFNALLIRTNFSGVRYKLGWRGLKMSCTNNDAWTCKLDGMKGVYGIACTQDNVYDDYYQGVFQVYYFPSEDDDYLENHSLDAIGTVGEEKYPVYVRNFPDYPEFCLLFRIGEVALSISKDLDGLRWSLAADERLTSIMPQGVYSMVDGHKHWIIEKGGVDRDLPAFEMAFPFYELIASSLTYNLEIGPTEAEIYGTEGEEGDNTRRVCLGYGGSQPLHHAEADGEGRNPVLLEAWQQGEEKRGLFQQAKWWCLHPGQLPGHRTPADNSNKPQLIILSGYLGAGKTTFVKNFIEYQTARRKFVAVIQNEIGETGLDARLLEDDYAVLEMDEGCVCCSLVGQLNRGIHQLLENHNPDFILLETSGLANPYNLLAEIEELKDVIDLISVTTVVDAVNVKEIFAAGNIAGDQVLAADTLLLNKADKLDAGALKRLKQELHYINTRAEVVECTFGDVNPALLYKAASQPVVDMEELMAFSEDHHHNHSDEKITARKFRFEEPLDRQRFLSAIDTMKGYAYRIKGVVEFTGMPGRYLFQYVNGQYEVSEAPADRNDESFLIFIGNQQKINSIKQTNFQTIKTILR